MSDKKSEEYKTESQIHYENLITFFKWIVSIVIVVITIFVALVYFAIGDSVSEVKNNITTSLDPIAKNFERTITNLQDNLKLQNETTDKRFEVLMLQAENLAIEETRKRVESAFEENNITNLVKSVAEERLRKQLTLIVQNELITVQHQIALVSEIFVAKELINSSSDRKAFRYLDSLRKFSIDPFIRGIADSALEREITDYEVYYASELKSPDQIQVYLKHLKLNQDDFNDNNKSFVGNLYKTISTSEDLGLIAEAIKVLNHFTKNNFKMFDFTAIENWYKNNYK